MKFGILILCAGNVSAAASQFRGGSRRKLYDDLKVVSPPMQAANMDVCEGNCSDDRDCKPGLRCFHREKDSTKPVPFCTGGESDKPGKDYCTYRPDGLNYYRPEGARLWLSNVVNNWDENDPPLQMCEGDCDSDDACAYGLHCFHRGSGVPGRNDNAYVPQCWNAGGKPGRDYCTKLPYSYDYECENDGTVDFIAQHRYYPAVAGLTTQVGGKLIFEFPRLPASTSDVDIIIYGSGSFGQGTEYVLTTANGSLGSVTTGATNCDADQIDLEIPMDEFNSKIAADQKLIVEVEVPVPPDTACGGNYYMSIYLDYFTTTCPE